MKNEYTLKIDEKASLEQRLEALRKYVRTLQEEVKITQNMIRDGANPNQTNIIDQINEQSSGKEVQ